MKKHAGVKRVVQILAVWMMIMLLFAAPAGANTIMQDGIEVSLRTDKESYEAFEKAEARLVVTNAGTLPMENVRMSIQAPEGFVLLNGNSDETQIAQLNAGASGEHCGSVGGEDYVHIPDTGDGSHGVFWAAVFILSCGMLGMTAMRRRQGKRLISLLLSAAILCPVLTIPVEVKAESADEHVITIRKEVLVNGETVVLTGTVTYEVTSVAGVTDGERLSITDGGINGQTQSVTVRMGDTLSFSGVISAPEGDTLSAVHVFVYDADAEEPYTMGEKYFSASGLNAKTFDLVQIPEMIVGDQFGAEDGGVGFAMEEGGRYDVMFYAADSAGRSFADANPAVDGDQGPAIRVNVKTSPSNCSHPHDTYVYSLHSSGQTRVMNYGDELMHQIEPLYERYCGLCDLYLMDIWGQGTGEAHTMVEGVCSVCAYGGVMLLSEEEACYEYTVQSGEATIDFHSCETVGENVVIPETLGGYPVTKINGGAFTFTEAASITCPSSLEEIGPYAFASGGWLKEIRVNKQAWVDSNAFENCPGVTVYGWSGSSAETAAQKAGCTFVSTGSLTQAPTLTVEQDEINHGDQYFWSVSHPTANVIEVKTEFESVDGMSADSGSFCEYESGGEYMGTADRYYEDDYIITLTARVWVNGAWSAAQKEIYVVYAAAESGDYQYTVSNGKATITGYLGADADVTIPGELDGYPVSDIDAFAFDGTDVKTITIPSSLKELSDGGFYGCDSLTDIYTHKNLWVDTYAFGGCAAGVKIHGYSGGSVEAAANACGCTFVSLGSLSSAAVPVVTVPSQVNYGDGFQVIAECAGAEEFDIWLGLESDTEKSSHSFVTAAQETGKLVDSWYANMTPACNYKMTFKISACIDGEWTAYSAPATVSVIYSANVLEAPQIDIPARVAVHEDLSISWDPVEHAEEYEVWLVPVSDTVKGSYPIGSSTPDESEWIIPAEKLYGYFYDETRDELELKVEVTAKADGYSPSKGEAAFTAFIYTLGEPQIAGLPQKICPGDYVTVTWEAVEHSQKADSVYYEFYLVHEDGEEQMIGSFQENGEAEHTCTLSFPADLAEGSYTLRVLATADGMGLKDSDAEHSVEVVGEYEYEVVDGKAVITAYHGTDADVNVPSSLGGYPVTRIGDGAFQGNMDITDVTLPASVTEIGARGFKNCTSLESIVGSGVTRIGEEAFYGCVNLIRVQFYQEIYYIGENAFHGVELPEDAGPLTVYVSGSSSGESFEGNHIIGKVVYPEGTTVIPARTHYDNTRLEEVYLPLTLEEIGAQAFGACGVLSYVKLYDEIESIADDAFSNSPNTQFQIMVKDMDTVSYVEQYAIDHQIPYTKQLYVTDEPAKPSVQIGEGVVKEEGNEYWVEVNVPVLLKAAGSEAEYAKLYLDDACIGEYDFADGYAQAWHTFTEIGDVEFKAEAYSGEELLETSETKIIHVIASEEDEDTLSFSVDKTQVTTGEIVTFTVNAPGAAQVRMIVDGDVVETLDMSGDSLTFGRAFTKSGERETTFCALIDGEWTQPCAVQVITVTSAGKLDAPVPQTKAVHLVGEDVSVSWAAVANASGYAVRVYDAGGSELYLNNITATEITIASDVFVSPAVYTISVMAYGKNYDQSEGGTSTEIVQSLPAVKLPNVQLENLNSGDVITDAAFTVSWKDVKLTQGMAFGGYCVLLEKHNGTAYVPVLLGEDVYYAYLGSDTQYALDMLEAGGSYRLHVFTLEEGCVEPNGEKRLHGETVVDFSYRTVPAFEITSVSGGDLGDPITVKWNAPAWPHKSLAPEFYMVSLIGPDGKQIGDAVRVQSSAALEYTFAGEGVTVMGRYTVCVAARMASWDTQTYRAQHIATAEWNVGNPAIVSVERTSGVYQYVNDQFEYTVEANRQTHHIRVRGVGDKDLIFTRDSRDDDFEISFSIAKPGIYSVKFIPETYENEKGSDRTPPQEIYVIGRIYPYQTWYVSAAEAPLYSLPGITNGRKIACGEAVEVRGELDSYLYVFCNGGTYFVRKADLNNEQTEYIIVHPGKDQEIDIWNTKKVIVEWVSYPGAEMYEVQIFGRLENSKTYFSFPSIWISAQEDAAQQYAEIETEELRSEIVYDSDAWRSNEIWNTEICVYAYGPRKY